MYHTAVGEDGARRIAPRIRPGAVKKTDAILRLVGTPSRVATIIAPAGYGKTTLLAQWAAVDPRPFAWIAADKRDDDTIVFLRDIAAAIHEVEPIPSAVFDALSGPSDSVWIRVPVVGNTLAALRGPVVLAIEDLQAITNPLCLDVLAALLDYVKPGSMVVVASREEPALPLARWRANGVLVEIETADLRLDANEAHRLIAGAGVSLDRPDIAELTRRTEGWPAGLYLAALSIRAGATAPRSAERFEDGDRYIADYFRVEVLSRLGVAEARFLVRTSVLEQVTGALCDAVLEASGSASLLGSIERSNRFVIALDHRSQWFRYHHLFRELLRSELARTEPEAIPELNRRAMAWCVANDDLEAAVRYGHAAGEIDVVASLVDRLVMPLYYDGRIETLEEWFGWFSEDDLQRFPAIALDRAWLHAMAGRASEAELYVSLAARTTADLPLSDKNSDLASRAVLLSAFMMPNGVEEAIAGAEMALDQLPPSSPSRATARLVRGVALSLIGSPDDALAELLAAVDTARALGGRDPVYVAQAQLALIEARRGAWADAARHAGEAQRVVAESGLDRHPPTALVHAAVLRVAIHERRIPDARAAMGRILGLRPRLDHSLPWLSGQVWIELARAHLALGEVAEARLSLADISRILVRRPDLGSLVDDERELRDRLAEASGAANGWAVSLTAAELRLLPYLATHLSFPEIAAELFVTSHTIRSQAKSIYAKFEASSRAEAIERAIKVGLLEPIFPPRVGVAV